MSLIDSLLGSIIRPDADALVMHVGEKPYVVGTSGAVELSSRALTADAVTSVLDHALPIDSRRALAELGAVEYDLPVSPVAPRDRFTIVAARGGDDIWVEIRRHRGTPAEPIQPQPAAVQPVPPVAAAAPSLPDAAQAVVLPLTRNSFRPDPPARPLTSPRLAGLDRLIRLAAARGATALYLTSGGTPSIRVDGEIRPLEGEPALAAADVAALLIDLAPEPSRQALRSGEETEWLCEVPEVGRVRCMSFRDHRGPGGIFRLIAARAVSADQLGLSREIQSLCAEPGGLIVITGRRSSGKSTLVSALLDVINRTRSEHVITLESEIKFVQQNRSSLVSQREVRGDNEEWLAVARAALRENPDVLVIEDVRSPGLAALALEAAQAGRLVIVTLAAADAAGAIARLVDQFPRERREQIQLMLADVLRGVVAQVLLRGSGGARIAARELLLNTPAVARLMAGGKLTQLPAAMASGRKHGIVPLNDALVAFVKSGAVDVREAWRNAFDRDGFLALLKREGLDTSFAERLA